MPRFLVGLAFFSLLADLAVVLGVVIALQQLRLSREEANLRRKRELAEEMLVTVAQVEDAFRYCRNLLDTIPKDKAGDREFIYRRRYERLQDQEAKFMKLREMQVRCEAVMGDVGLRKHVTELFNYRNEIAWAITDLAEFDSDQGSPTQKTDQDNRNKTRRILYGTWSHKDEFGMKILKEIKAIRLIVCQAARLNGEIK